MFVCLFLSIFADICVLIGVLQIADVLTELIMVIKRSILGFLQRTCSFGGFDLTNRSLHIGNSSDQMVSLRRCRLEIA